MCLIKQATCQTQVYVTGCSTFQNLVDRLSVPSSHGPSKLDLKLDPTLKHTTFSDAKNCRFQPVTVAGQRRKKLSAQEQSSPDNNTKKEDAKFSFINRQEVCCMYVLYVVCMYVWYVAA